MRSYTRSGNEADSTHGRRGRTAPRTSNKRTIGRPGDAFEREADRAADQALRPGAEAPRLPRATGGAGAASPLARGMPGASGRPLDAPTRGFFEARFERDFSQVRLHTDSAAGCRARDLGARAFTTGRDIVFAPGQYAPETAAGRHLLAHELTHVLQQGAAPNQVPAIQRQPDGSPAAPEEEEAQAAPSPGDQFRKAVLSSAQARLKTGQEIMSQKQIDKIRLGWAEVGGEELEFAAVTISETGEKEPVTLPTFTTCVNFAGDVAREGAKALAGGDRKALMVTAQMMPEFFKMFSKESELLITIRSLKKSLRIYEKPMAQAETRRATEAAEVATLEAAEPTGEKAKDLLRKQKLAAARARLKQIEAHLRTMARDKGKIDTRIATAEGGVADLQAKNQAWIRTAPGLPGGRPKAGEFVLWGQIAKGAYSVQGGGTVELQAGAFRHISVFVSHETVKPGVEAWHTIDGGGVTAREHTYFVRLSDLKAFAKEPPATPAEKPWDEPAAMFMLAGWVDADKLVAQTPAPGAGQAQAGARGK